MRASRLVSVSYTFAVGRARIASFTALDTTARRATGTQNPDPSVRNPKWLAEHFISHTERQLLEGISTSV